MRFLSNEKENEHLHLIHSNRSANVYETFARHSWTLLQRLSHHFDQWHRSIRVLNAEKITFLFNHNLHVCRLAAFIARPINQFVSCSVFVRVSFSDENHLQRTKVSVVGIYCNSKEGKCAVNTWIRCTKASDCCRGDARCVCSTGGKDTSTPILLN